MNEEDYKTQAQRLCDLFKSNQRSSGVFNVKNGRVATVYVAPQMLAWYKHLTGEEGIGCVPITDDNTCTWAAIDIDNHGMSEDIPIAEIEKLRVKNDIPVILCRSKSGGIHAYAFFKTPVPCAKARNLLNKWAQALGFPGAEIFPKQTILRADQNGVKQHGNWINMPYLGYHETNRYAYHDEHKLGLEEFIVLADTTRIDAKVFINQMMVEHKEAPPCIHRIMVDGVVSGQRNEAMFNVAVYLRKSDPTNLEKNAMALNEEIFDRPLAKSELKRTITSASRPDYHYRCGEEPLRSFCEREACLKRQFGIGADQSDTVAMMQELPEFTGLVKYMTEPIRWDISIGGAIVCNISTQQLLDWRMMREYAAERLMKVLPMIKPIEWERILAKLMEGVRIIDVPDDASTAGVIRDRLREFCSKSNLLSDGTNLQDRKAILRGMPVVQGVSGERCVCFRSQDFINYLKRTKSEELKGNALWFAIKHFGSKNQNIRIGDVSVSIWAVPVDALFDTEVILSLEQAATTDPKFTTDY